VFPKHQIGFAGNSRGPSIYDVDLTRPMAEWKSAWRVARRAARVHYRWHDLRHTFISRLAENPKISEQTITALAGHVSKRMLERHSHIRAQAKRDAIASLESSIESERAQNWAQISTNASGYIRETDDKPPNFQGFSLERVIGFEPTTSCLASTRSTN